jgi:predicted acylesterase/phospholipase RssA
MLVNVAISGSGQLYPVFIGALRCLSDRGFKIAEISATSGGAIIAAALASGYNPSTTMVDLVKRTLPLRNGLFDPSLFTFFFNWGFIKGMIICGSAGMMVWSQWSSP